jgi:hypothetical protein
MGLIVYLGYRDEFLRPVCACFRTISVIKNIEFWSSIWSSDKMDQQYTGLLCGRYVILPICSFQPGVKLQLFINSTT